MRRVVSSLALTLAIVAVAVFVRAQQREHLVAQSASDPNRGSVLFRNRIEEALPTIRKLSDGGLNRMAKCGRFKG